MSGNGRSPLKRQRKGGFSLLELMIALALGLLLMSGIVLVYLESRRQSLVEAEGARLQQAGRYALSLLQHELLMAGFYGRLTATSNIPRNPSAPGCGALTGWSLEPLPAIDLIDDVASSSRLSVHGQALDCLPSGTGGIAPGTDVLVIKRTAAEPTLARGELATGVSGAEASQWYLQADEQAGTARWYYVPDGGDFPAGSNGMGQYFWEAYAAIFFIRPWSQAGDGVPTLCVERLSANSMGPAECLVEGVEDLQFSFGLDADRDGRAERFSDRPTALELDQATVARVALLIRSLNPVPGIRGGGEAGRNSGLDDDGYLRQWFSATVALRNHHPLRGAGR
ncbi:prepilin-type N-terminal cleavage/methylation domain-containing protein [Parahaliea maris]|uniref:Prepilin-type N-terminal cleavage/methylation domain-containing protein n=1 Tax=Parahaliea maris TaxID=2716870 RepID=A0A5C8ZSH7_9GAMM|nr:PilW family protein [Parahaliea maris]TXS91416.1 prepilin-type N-terminal cleavage/methylation domain-containing protein [Parahaliea maris]